MRTILCHSLSCTSKEPVQKRPTLRESQETPNFYRPIIMRLEKEEGSATFSSNMDYIYMSIMSKIDAFRPFPYALRRRNQMDSTKISVLRSVRKTNSRRTRGEKRVLAICSDEDGVCGQEPARFVQNSPSMTSFTLCRSTFLTLKCCGRIGTTCWTLRPECPSAQATKLCRRWIDGDVAFMVDANELDYRRLESPVVGVVRTVLRGDHNCSEPVTPVPRRQRPHMTGNAKVALKALAERLQLFIFRKEFLLAPFSSGSPYTIWTIA